MPDIKKIKGFIDKNLKWLVLIGAIAGLFLFFKSHRQNIVTQISSLTTLILVIYYLLFLEKDLLLLVKKGGSKILTPIFNFLTNFSRKIQSYFIKHRFLLIPLTGITLIVLSYSLAFIHYQKQGFIKPLKENLLLHFDFEEGKGKIIYNKSPLKIKGNIEGSFNWTEGIRGLSLEFLGQDSQVVLEKEIYLDCQSSSIIWWMKMKDTNYRTIFSKGEKLSCGQIETMKEEKGDKRKIRLETDTNNKYYQEFDTGLNITDIKWHHYALTFGPEKVTLFVDGKFKESKNPCTDPKGLSIKYIGTQQNQETYIYGDWFKGKLDQVKIYDKELNKSEVGFLYQSSFLYSSLFRIITAITLVILSVIISLEIYLKRENE